MAINRSKASAGPPSNTTRPPLSKGDKRVLPCKIAASWAPTPPRTRSGTTRSRRRPASVRILAAHRSETCRIRSRVWSGPVGSWPGWQSLSDSLSWSVRDLPWTWVAFTGGRWPKHLRAIPRPRGALRSRAQDRRLRSRAGPAFPGPRPGCEQKWRTGWRMERSPAGCAV